MRSAVGRRNFMHMAGVALGGSLLPLASRAQESGAGKPPLRVLTIVDPYGISGDRTESWMAPVVGTQPLTAEALGWALEPLSGHLPNLNVVSNLNQVSRSVLGGSAAHFSVNGHALSASKGFGGRASGIWHSHPSIDAYLGQFLNDEYGLVSGRVYPHVVIAGGYGYSFGPDGQPLGGIRSPQALYQSVLGTDSLARLSSRELVLEQVRKQLQVVRPQLAQANASTVMDAYESSVQAVAREVELRQDLFCESNAPDSFPGAKSAEGFQTYLDAIFQMFACDLTSSVTFGTEFQMKHGFLSGEVLAEGVAGLNLNHHALSHRSAATTGQAQALVFRWRNQLLSAFLDRLAATPEADGTGTLMDNTMVVLHCAMSHNTHQTNGGIPTLVIAGDNTNIRGGQHVDATDRSNNEFFTTLAQGVHSSIDRFGGYKADTYVESLNTGPIVEMLKEVLS